MSNIFNKKKEQAVSIEFTSNLKQKELMQAVLRETVPSLRQGYMYFWFGGGIRGGKTFGCMGALIVLAKRYPGSRWAIIRSSMKRLKESSIVSMDNILRGADVTWRRSDSDYFVQFSNGSRIYFKGENKVQDPNMTSFLGLEMNGFLLEQTEELSIECYDACIQRCGTYQPRHPDGGIMEVPPFLFATFNPTPTWVKAKIYLKWKRGELKKPHIFFEALADNNKYVGKMQWENWKNMSSKQRKQFLEGSWDFDIDGQFMWAFSEKKHVGKVPLKAGLYTYLSFDFNANPMTCTIHQTDMVKTLHTVKEFRLSNQGVPDMCDAVGKYLDDNLISRSSIYVTGDSTGKNRNSALRKAMNVYAIVQQELGLESRQFKLLNQNPFISDSWDFCNQALERLDIKVDEGCEYLLRDFKNCLAGSDNRGNINKVEIGLNAGLNIDNRELWHLLDTWRYMAHLCLYGSYYQYRS